MEPRVRPNLWQLLDHIYLEHPALTLLTAGVAVVAGMVLMPGMVNELFAGNTKETLAYLVLMGVALLPLAGQTWFYGTEGWSPVDKYNYYRLWGDHGGNPDSYEQWSEKN